MTTGCFYIGQEVRHKESGDTFVIERFVINNTAAVGEGYGYYLKYLEPATKKRSGLCRFLDEKCRL